MSTDLLIFGRRIKMSQQHTPKYGLHKLYEFVLSAIDSVAIVHAGYTVLCPQGGGSIPNGQYRSG